MKGRRAYLKIVYALFFVQKMRGKRQKLHIYYHYQEDVKYGMD